MVSSTVSAKSPSRDASDDRMPSWPIAIRRSTRDGGEISPRAYPAALDADLDRWADRFQRDVYTGPLPFQQVANAPRGW